MVVADKGKSSDKLRYFICAINATSDIPRKIKNLIGEGDVDWRFYKCRHLVEKAFGRINQYTGMGTTYKKLKLSYSSLVALAVSMIWVAVWSD